MIAASELKATIQESEEALVEFRNIVLQLPRLTSVLNKAKRNVARVLNDLIIEFQTALSLTNEALAMIERAGREHAARSDN